MYYLIHFLGILFSRLKDRNQILHRLFLGLLYLLSVFRYGVGPDYFSYKRIYRFVTTDVIQEISNASGTEFGFRLLVSLSKNLVDNYVVFLAIISFIILFFLNITVQRYSKNPTLSLLLYYSFYYFAWLFSGIRQALTISIGIYVLLKTFETKRELKFIIMIILLATIHASILIIIPVYFVTKIDWNRKRLVWMLSATFLVSLLPIQLIFEKLSWIPYSYRFLYYIDSYEGILSSIDFQSIVRLMFVIISLYFYDEYVKESEISKKMIEFYLVSFMIYFIFKSSELSAARVSIYGKYLDIIIFTNFMYLFKLSIDRKIYYIGLILFSLTFLQKELNTMMKHAKIDLYEENILVPYITHWNYIEYKIVDPYIK